MSTVIRRMTQQGSDEGSISAFVLGLVVSLFLVAGLVIDGGRALNAHLRVIDDAEHAARAGGAALDTEALRSGEPPRIDRASARETARAYLVERGYSASKISYGTEDGADEFTVTVEDSMPTTILSVIFIREFDVRGSATARAASGIVCEGMDPACP